MVGVRYSKRRAPGVVGLDENIAIYTIAPSISIAKQRKQRRRHPTDFH